MEKYLEELKNIEQAKIDITKLYLLSCFKFSLDNDKDEWKAVNYCYDLWLHTDIDLSLSKLADVVADKWQEIKADEITDEEIIEEVINF